jgi:hypothetical protein
LRQGDAEPFRDNQRATRFSSGKDNQEFLAAHAAYHVAITQRPE